MHPPPDPNPAADATDAGLLRDQAATERADRVLLHLTLCAGTATLLLALATSLGR
jgi:hypothetical protein